MQLGLTWPLQRLLHISVPYGNPTDRGFCWDAHCITLHGKSSLLLVHCESRYTFVRFDMTPFDWSHLTDIVMEELQMGLEDAGFHKEIIAQYLAEVSAIQMTRTHGRREVAFLNRAWEDVLSADLLVDSDTQRQPFLNHAVNQRICRCAGRSHFDTARTHLAAYFNEKYNIK